MWVKEIKRLAVRGGFLDGVEISFHSGLNCIIGSRGTGKSSILNLLRYAMGDWTSNPRAFIRQISEILENGQVEVDFVNEFNNVRCITRKVGRYPRLLDEDGQVIQQGSELFFRMEAYQQGELERLLDQGGTVLMELLDRTMQELPPLQKLEQANRDRRIQVQQQYEAQCQKLNQLKEKVERKNLLLGELEGLNLNEPARRQNAINQETALLQFWERFLSSRLRGMKTLLSADYHNCKPEETAALNPDLTDELIAIVNRTLETRDNLAEQLMQVLEEGLTNVQKLGQRLADRHCEQEEEIRRCTKEQGFAGCDELEKHRQKIMLEISELCGCEEEYHLLLDQTTRLMEKKNLLLMEAQRLETKVSQARRSAVNRLNSVLAGSPFIRFHQNSYLEEYRCFLLERMQGHVSRRLVDIMVQRVDPRSLIRITDRADHDLLSRILGCESYEAREIIWILGNRSDSGRMTEIPVRDEAELYYVGRSGVESVSSYRLSRGTQCSLLLPIILLSRQPVLMGDQFEDHLDNACIYEMIIPRLLQIKGDRQVILATHNPNIVVAGQTDHVIAMTLDNGKGQLKLQGTLAEDEVRQEIMSTLEGGQEAFCRRIEYLGVG